MPDSEAIAQAILRQPAARGPGKSICPSEVARELGGEAWRSLMTPVRQAAIRLARAGQVLVLRKGKPVPPEGVKGVIRVATPEEPTP